MLTTSTSLEKYFYFAHCCHGYKDLHVGEVEMGVFSKHDFPTTNYDRSANQLLFGIMSRV